MKWSSLLSFCLVLAPAATAAQGTSNTSALLDELSPCTLSCLFQVVPTVGCGVFDIACQCASDNLTTIASKCMLQNCTVEESLKLVQVDAVQCNRPHNSTNTAVWAFQTIACVVTYGVVILRIISRLRTAHTLWWDDWFHVAAAIWAVPLNAFVFLMAAHGFGNHLWDIDTAYSSRISQWFYLCQIFWGTSITFIKISILCLYLRLFPQRSFKLAVYISLVFVTVTFTIIMMTAIFQCVPVAAVWDLNIKGAKCLNIKIVAYASAAFNIVTELIILVLPLPILASLHLGLRRKIGLYALFTAGVLVIVVASARIPSLTSVGQFNDPTYDNFPAYMWTCAEALVANVCAAAPALRSLFSQVRTRGHVEIGSQQQQQHKLPSASGEDHDDDGENSMTKEQKRRRMSSLPPEGGIRLTKCFRRDSRAAKGVSACLDVEVGGQAGGLSSYEASYLSTSATSTVITGGKG